MDSDGPGARAAGVKIRDQRQRGRNVERLADAHQRSQGEHLRIGLGMTGRPGHRRPDEQTADDHPAAVELVGQESAHRTQERIYPHEDGHERPKILVVGDARDVGTDVGTDGGDHLPVEIIQQGHRPEQRHHDPRIGGNFLRTRSHHRVVIPKLSVLNLNFAGGSRQ